MSYALQPGLPTPFSEFYKILDFLIKPVQKLFKERNTREALRLLNILAVRHQHAYQRPGEIDWRQDFQTDTEFFDLITSMSLIELADLLNDNDYIEFLQLSPKDTVKNGYTLQLLHRRWNHLCERVKECIIADRNLGLRVRELAQVSMI